MADDTDIQHPSLINRGIDAEISGWPASLTEDDPGPDDPAARADWFRDQKRVADAVKEHTGTGDEPDEDPAKERVKERFPARGI